MIFKRFYDENLAQASYMLACEKTREALVVDPNLDIVQYERAAAEACVRIVHVTETHIHADFVSGVVPLAKATGARLHLSAEGSDEWGYADPVMQHAGALRDGSEITFGSVLVRAMHTPGHTPEHLIFFVTDRDRGDEPAGAFTGDFVFVGDVGRPDLLERAVGAKGSMKALARDLYRSLQRFKSQADHLQIWPGHGAGSVCGKSLGSMPQSTVGYEKLFNWALAEMTENEFVASVLEDQPAPPGYFAEMKRVNRMGVTPPDAREPVRSNLSALESALTSGATVIDTRAAASFAEGHVRGTVNIPLGKSFLNWTGSIAPYDRGIFLILEARGGDAVNAIADDLRQIGLHRFAQYFTPDVLCEWESKHGALETVRQIEAADLHDLTSGTDVQVVDVRAPHEWKAGHLPRAIHIPLAALPARIGELDRSVPIVLHCKVGGRSAIATSLLQSRGIADVSNLEGGYDGWAARGFEIVKPDAKSSRKPAANRSRS